MPLLAAKWASRKTPRRLIYIKIQETVRQQRLISHARMSRANVIML
jgi:hypothetical protein